MRMLRAVYFRAVDEGLIQGRMRLFGSVYTNVRNAVKRALNEKVMRTIHATSVPSAPTEEARRIFLLLFMLRGIGPADRLCRSRGCGTVRQQGGQRCEHPSGYQFR